MANEKIHEYLDTASISDLANYQTHIDCEVNEPAGWKSKQLPVTAIKDFIDAPNQKIYGAFYDEDSQLHTNINQGKAIKVNSSSISNGVYISNDIDSRPTLIYVPESGIYNFQFSLQMERISGGSSKQASIWLRQNYNDVAWTNTHLTFVANSGKLVASWNFLIQCDNTQPIQLIWSVDDIGIEIISEPATGVHPATPSAIFTIHKL